jgi:AcrR family transcriptional regulator
MRGDLPLVPGVEDRLRIGEVPVERPATPAAQNRKETIEAHRHAMREATLDTATALVAEQGLTAVSKPQIAQRAGSGPGSSALHDV